MDDRAYRIGEVAQLLGVKTSTIRFWEDEFRQLRPRRTDKGQRYYYEKDIEVLKEIQNLLHEDGMTITGVKKLLKKRNAVQNSDFVTQNAAANATEDGSQNSLFSQADSLLESGQKSAPLRGAYFQPAVQQSGLQTTTGTLNDSPSTGDSPNAASLVPPPAGVMARMNAALPSILPNAACQSEFCPVSYPESSPESCLVSAQQNSLPLAPECENCRENHLLSAENAVLHHLLEETLAELKLLRKKLVDANSVTNFPSSNAE